MRIEQPCPGHFICADRCGFHKTTYVDGYIVSTVGEMTPLIFGSSYGKKYEEIGYKRLYETMVFKAKKISPKPSCGCIFQMKKARDIEMLGYNNRKDAIKGHEELVKKYERKSK